MWGVCLLPGLVPRVPIPLASGQLGHPAWRVRSDRLELVPALARGEVALVILSRGQDGVVCDELPDAGAPGGLSPEGVGPGAPRWEPLDVLREGALHAWAAGEGWAALASRTATPSPSLAASGCLREGNLIFARLMVLERYF